MSDALTADILTPDIAAGLDELAKAHRILAMLGHEDLTSGHLSWRDPHGRGFWMKRSQIGMDEAFVADDFVLLDFDGRKLAGPGSCHVEWPIHAEIMRSRPEVKAVGHTHAFYSQIFSTTDEPLRPVGKQGAWFDDVPKFKQTCNLIRTPELGRSLAATLGGADAVFILAHGIAFAGTTIREMTLIGVFLEKAVRAHVTIASTGFAYSWPTDEDIRSKRGETRTPRGIDNYFNYLERHLER
ncbi:MAG TPA: class II aldolase/adducin family protein [Caballeronia sp.]|nr:class II aldolase/adducin family protein [Caballeronia sp.]